MKKGKIFTNCLCLIFAIIATITTTGCSPELESIQINDTQVPMEINDPFSITLKVYSDNKDITSKGDIDNITLYIFDDKNDFFEERTVDRTYYLQAKPILVNCPQTKKITVIALCNTSSEDVSTINHSNIVSDLTVKLKENNGVVTEMPDDLFHGQITIERAVTTKAATSLLKMERKVASMSLIVKNASRLPNSGSGEFYFKIKESKSEINYKGELTGKDIVYTVPATIKNNHLTTGNFTVFPAENYTIELYQNENCILSSEEITKSENLTTTAGGQLSVIIDFSKKNCDVIVSEWGTVIQIVTVE